jgi:putative transposase
MWDKFNMSIKTMPRCVKVRIPDKLCGQLDNLYPEVYRVAELMLKNRSLSSSKYWKTIPSAIANNLIHHYQRNRKCKKISHLVIPILGDRGIQVRKEGCGIRVPSIFKKEIITAYFSWVIVGFIRQVIFTKKDGYWSVIICANTPCKEPFSAKRVIGVDRNAVGNIAVVADMKNGKVFKLGIDPAGTKRCFRGRRGNLQKEKKYTLLKKIRRKQSRRMTYENHRVSKTVVDYAARHRRAIVLEDLKGVNTKGSKIRKYSEKNQWAFAQLAGFIEYKAALRGVPVIYVDPAYTSQRCSRCGHIQKPVGKRYSCAACGHKEHRDANAAFNIGRLGAEVLRASGGGSLSVLPSGSIGGPYAGKERAPCAG